MTAVVEVEPRDAGRSVTGAAIEVRDLTRAFGGKPALDGVSLTVRPGEIHALLGPNGAGKTTLLRILIGLVSPDAGTVTVGGQDAGRSARATRSLMGFVPSGDRSFYLRISGVENLAFFARLYGLSRREAVPAAWRALEEVGLGEVGRARVNTYSHGMQRRLSLARALLTRPAVLLVDEATHDLDPQGAQRIRALIRGLAADGATVLWTTQRVEEVRGFADRVTLLRRGRVRFGGTVPQLLAHALPRRHALTLRLAGGGLEPAELDPLVEGVGKISAPIEAAGEYILSVEDGVVLGEALARLTAAGVDILSCRAERPEIEDAFLSLTEELCE